MMRVQNLEHQFSQEQLVTGIELRHWMKLLQKNKWAVDRHYLHRAAWVTGLSIPASILGRLDDLKYARQIAAMDIDPTPLIVIGHWRTGTTHLHNMLGRDPNNTFSTLYQCIFPTSFLSTGRIGPRLLRNSLPEKRSYDNVKQGWFEAAEDEIGLMKLTGGLSFYTALMFPDRYAEYEKYIDFLEATPEERHTWKKALEHFIKKIMLQTGGKRVVLKSCPHSARIRMLLDMFPDAKFIHIHRHPARSFRSMLHMRGKVDWENFMHAPQRAFIDERWEMQAELSNRLYTRIIEDRELIPKENLVEVAYRDLVGNERDFLRDTYAKLEIPEWDRFDAVLKPYLDSIQGYKVNKLEIDTKLEDFVYDRLRLVYDTYGYEKRYTA
jgi:hypothetical protein